MKSFLTQVAAEILASSRPLHEHILVFQNRRAGLYFKSLIKDQISGTARLPEILTIEDFAGLVCPFRTLDTVELLFEFYRVYKNSGGHEEFREFAGWAPVLLKDFDDMDAYMVPPDQLLKHVRDLQSLNAWEPGGEQTARQKNYVEFWQRIPQWYEALRLGLTSRKMAWKGLVFRLAADEIGSFIKKNNQFVVFAGFNALTTAEETIFKELIKHKQASVFWDADEFYMKSVHREAGLFLRQYRNTWAPSMTWIGDDLTSTGKKITVIGASQQIAQVRVAVQTLDSLPALDSTAVVLADENLLQPLLQHLPEKIGDFNVSMGSKLHQSTFFNFLKCLFQMHVNARDGRYHHRDAVSLLLNPHSMDLSSFSDCTKAIAKIREEKIVWIDPPVLVNDSPDLQPVLDLWKNPADAFQTLATVIDYLRERALESSRSPLEIEVLYQFSLINTQLSQRFREFEISGDLQTAFELMSEMARSTRIPYSGEPLVGLQIMGILETRSIDFRNVIVLGMNENILPLGKTQPSMIPYEVRRTYTLPTHGERDAIYAYNFFRLLQRAEDITLVYNTETDAFGRGEISRFVTQLTHELPSLNKQATIRQFVAATPLGKGRSETPLVVEKDADVMKSLQAIAEKGLSPSRMLDLVRCPMRFYFRSVAKIEAFDDLEDTAEANTVGLAIHNTLEAVYKSISGKKLDPKWVAEQRKTIANHLRRAFEAEKISQLETGKNRLIFDLSVEALLRLLDHEELRARNGTITVMSLEEKVSTSLDVNGTKVTIIGRIDRVDEENGNRRIIDYKTGKTRSQELPKNGLQDLVLDPDHSVLFQLMTYALTQAGKAGTTGVVPSVYWLRGTPVELKSVANHGSKSDYVVHDEQLSEFSGHLTSLLSTLFDPTIPFSRTEDEKRCKFCEFTTICNRSARDPIF